MSKMIQFEPHNNYYCFLHAVERVIQFLRDRGKTAEDAKEIVGSTTQKVRCVRCSIAAIRAREEVKGI